MATGQPTKIGKYTVQSKRRGISGEYQGIVGDGSGYAVHCTRRYSGRGAKDRAFQDARKWALEQAEGQEQSFIDQGKV